MMRTSQNPRSKSDLIRALQKMPIAKIEILDGYTPADEKDLLKKAKDLAKSKGDVTIIMVRS